MNGKSEEYCIKLPKLFATIKIIYIYVEFTSINQSKQFLLYEHEMRSKINSNYVPGNSFYLSRIATTNGLY